MDAREMIIQGLIKGIGTGEKTHAWNDNWLPRESSLRPIACCKANPPVTVEAFIDSATAT
jgi:hypothetical protein